MSSLVASTSVPRVAWIKGMNDPIQKATARRWKTSNAESTGESRRTVWPASANDAATASAGRSAQHWDEVALGQRDQEGDETG